VAVRALRQHLDLQQPVAPLGWVPAASSRGLNDGVACPCGELAAWGFRLCSADQEQVHRGGRSTEGCRVTCGALQPPGQVPATAGAKPFGRVVWIDNLKVATIAGVVVFHAATAYITDVAGWYYEERKPPPRS
jgi:hypothetical protein